MRIFFLILSETLSLVVQNKDLITMCVYITK